MLDWQDQSKVTSRGIPPTGRSMILHSLVTGEAMSPFW